MLSLPRALLSVLLFLCSGPLLLSCTHTPPDVLGCTPYPAAEWPEMRETFFKLCQDDPVCAVHLPVWRVIVSTWTYPSDAGACVTWMTSHVYDLDPSHPLPASESATGRPQAYKDLLSGGVYLPAKESVAPMKTFIQSFCHDSKECGAAANWQGTVGSVDTSLKKQAAKVSSLEPVVQPGKKP